MKITLTYSQESIEAGQWLNACWSAAGECRLQSQLCKRAGLSRPHVYRVLQGERTLSIEKYEDIKKAATDLGLQPRIKAILLRQALGLQH